MSGDFDAIGLGLFNSPSHLTTNNTTHVSSFSSSSPPPPPPIFSMLDDLDKHYQFNNTEDFANNLIKALLFLILLKVQVNSNHIYLLHLQVVNSINICHQTH